MYECVREVVCVRGKRVYECLKDLCVCEREVVCVGYLCVRGVCGGSCVCMRV